MGFVDPFRPLSKIPTNGYYLDDVTDVDNAEYQLKKIMAAMRQLAKKVKEVIQSASDRENKCRILLTFLNGYVTFICGYSSVQQRHVVD